MKKCWSLLIPLTLMSLNFLGLILYAQPMRIDQDVSRYSLISNSKIADILGEVYVLSNPLNDPNELMTYVQSNSEYFGQNGIITLAARDLGNWIMANNVMGLEEDCLAKIEERLTRDDLSREYASQLLIDIKKNKFNCKAIAAELIWLSENLPKLAAGNLKDYLYSGTDLRMQMKNVLPIYETMHISDPEIAEIILQDKNCYQQKIADQIQLMALISTSNK